MWECQSLLQTSHICVVSGRMELLHSFLRAGLSASAAISLSSPVLRCCFYSTPPLYAISCKTLPGHSVDVDSLHISYADIIISQVSAAGCSPSRSQLPVEDVFWNAIILHSSDMPQPSQTVLSKQSEPTGKTNRRQDISVGYFVLPGYAQDTADASQVECVEPSLLPAYVVHV